MLFDESVKEDLKDFYDREEDIEKLKWGINEGRRLIVVLGIRRIGIATLYV